MNKNTYFSRLSIHDIEHFLDALKHPINMTCEEMEGARGHCRSRLLGPSPPLLRTASCELSALITLVVNPAADASIKVAVSRCVAALSAQEKKMKGKKLEKKGSGCPSHPDWSSSSFLSPPFIS